MIVKIELSLSTSYEHPNETDILPFHISSHPPVQQNKSEAVHVVVDISYSFIKTMPFDRILPYNEQGTVHTYYNILKPPRHKSW